MNAQLQTETNIEDFVQFIEAEILAENVRALIIGYSNRSAISLLIWLIGLKGAAIGSLGVIARVKEALRTSDIPEKDGGAALQFLGSWYGRSYHLAFIDLDGVIILRKVLASEINLTLKGYNKEKL